MKKSKLHLLVCCIGILFVSNSTVFSQLNGTYTIGATGDYTTIPDAFTDAEAQGVNGPVVFNLIDSDYDLGLDSIAHVYINKITGTSATNTITLKPDASQDSVTIIGTFDATVNANTKNGSYFYINGADNIIFDGSNNGTNSRNLVMIFGEKPWYEDSYAIKIDTATNVDVKNIIFYENNDFKSSYHHRSFLWARRVKNLSIENNRLFSSFDGIVIAGADTARSDSVIIQNNIIGNAADYNKSIRSRGINMNYIDNSIISHNTIENIGTLKDAKWQERVIGIYIGDACANSYIYGNTINGVLSHTDQYQNYQPQGIRIDADISGTISIINNMISGVRRPYEDSVSWGNIYPVSLCIADRTGDTKIYNNTIVMYDTTLTISNNNPNKERMIALQISSNAANGGAVDVRNNIIMNKVYDKDENFTDDIIAIDLGANSGDEVIDYNVYYVDQSNPNAYIGSFGGNKKTLKDWQTATGFDAHSYMDNVPVIDTGDLHIDPAGFTLAEMNGIPLPEVTLDIDGDLRDATYPDIGADEGVFGKLPNPYNSTAYITKSIINHQEITTLGFSSKLRDDSDLANGGAELSFSLDMTGTSTVNFTGATDSTDGKYGAQVIGNRAGTANGIVIKINGNPISASALLVTVNAILPTVTTTAISNIMNISADGGGDVTSDGGELANYGVCWSTSPTPTISDANTNDGNGAGAFTSSITGLDPLIDYYVRAYATNSAGTTYGNEVTFTSDTMFVTNITISSTGGATTLDVDSSLQMLSNVLPTNANFDSVTWKVDNTIGQASINDEGLLTGIAIGEVEVIATTTDGTNITDTFVVTIIQPVLSIELSSTDDSTNVYADSSWQFSALVLPANATVPDVVWSVNNITGAATINQSGLLTGTSNGTVEVIATATDGTGVEDRLTIDIIQLVTSINLSTAGNTTSIAIGDDITITPEILPADARNKNLVWSVDQDLLGSISDGVLSATAKGVIRVTATADDGSGVSQYIDITITNPVTNISIAQPDSIIFENEDVQLTATVLPADADNDSIAWKVINNTGTATIDADGLLSTTAAGTIQVEASSTDGSNISHTIDIQIYGKASFIIISAENNATELQVDESLQFTAKVYPSATSLDSVIWSTNNEFKATIDSTGLLTAHSEGALDVIATAADNSGIVASYNLNVIVTDVSNTLSKHTDVYPNPSNGIFQINAGNNTLIQSYSVIDISGKTMLKAENLNNTNISIDLADYKGQFLININTNKGTVTHKVIVK